VIALVPVAMAIAVLRYQLLDIRLLWTRTLTYALLSAAVIALYLLLIEVVGRPLIHQSGWGAPVFVTLLIAVVFNPVRVRLQHRVNRLLYGTGATPSAPRRQSSRSSVSGPSVRPMYCPQSARRCGCRTRNCPAPTASSIRTASGLNGWNAFHCDTAVRCWVS
jgi:hypothetical protein